MEHHHSDDEDTQEATRLGPEIEQGSERERQGDSHGSKASASQQTNDVGGRVIAEQEKHLQKMQG